MLNNDGASRAARVCAVHAKATPFDDCVHILRALHQKLMPPPPPTRPADASAPAPTQTLPQSLEKETKGSKRARTSTLFYNPRAPAAETTRTTRVHVMLLRHRAPHRRSRRCTNSICIFFTRAAARDCRRAVLRHWRDAFSRAQPEFTQTCTARPPAPAPRRRTCHVCVRRLCERLWFGIYRRESVDA